MQVTIRGFQEEDIQKKVEWINNPSNNRYLHYTLPLTIDKTTDWFFRVKDRQDRLDCVITADGIACGLIGLLHIDSGRREAEYYITMGETALKRKGIAFNASKLLLDTAFSSMGLTTVYLFTEPENRPAQHLFRKLGFKKESGVSADVYPGGKPAFRFVIHAPEWAD